MAFATGKKIILIGAPGSGKSSLGRAYAARHGVMLFDTDEVFLSRYGEISAFFERCGEAEFRRIESELQIEGAHSDAGIIVCGGGGVLNARAMAELRSAGDIALITAPTDVIKARIKDSDRPLKRDIEKLVVQRKSLYERYADYIVDNGDGGGLGRLECMLRAPRGNRYDVVLCDADDTLLDFQTAMRVSLINLKHQFGINTDDEALISAFRACTDDVFRRLEKGEIERSRLGKTRFEMLGKLTGEKIDSEKANKTFFEELKKTRFVREGALDFLRELRRRGIKTYIVTNSFAQIAEQRLKALDGYIDGAFVSETVGFDKPHVGFFERVYESIGRPSKDRMIIVGDSNTSDIAGGNAFGIDTCFYDPKGMRRTDALYRVRDYGDVLSIV